MRTARTLTVTVLVAMTLSLGAIAPSGSPPAEAAVPGANGKIAFVSYRSLSLPKIYLMDADGENVERLTDSFEREGDPAWSPDGARVAFTSDPDQRPFNEAVHVVNANGTGETPLTSNDGSQDPTWSPDGSRIAFVGSRDGVFDIYVMNDDGTNQKRLTDTDESEGLPTWSPDGTQIAYVRSGEIYVMDDDGTDHEQVTDNNFADGYPAWSPDGTRIAFDSFRNLSRDIFTVKPDGSGETQITTVDADVSDPAWSPDGTRIAYHAWDIFAIDSDGSDGRDATQLTTHRDRDDSPAWQPVAPSTVVDTYTSVPRTETFVASGGVLDNDQPGDWPVELVDLPSLGDVQLASDGSFTYRLADPFTDASVDTFTYRACPNEVLCSEPTTVTLGLEPPIDLVDDAVVCDLEEACGVDVLANDVPTDLLSLGDVEAVGDPHGVFFPDPDGGFEFTPSADHPGGDTVFTYTATVPTAAGGEATVPEEGTITATVRHDTSVDVTVDPAEPAESDDITLTATVIGPDGTDGDPSGTVEFFDGDQSLGTAELASPATLTVGDLAEGDHEIVAVYTGDSRFAPVTSDPVTLTVAPPDQADATEDTDDGDDSGGDAGGTSGAENQAATSPGATPTSPAASPSSPSSAKGDLAFTGANSPTLAVAAGILLTLGALFMSARREIARRVLATSPPDPAPTERSATTQEVR